MLSSLTKKPLCLRQGYNCTCDSCKEWIKRWDNEIKGFEAINTMLEGGCTTFEIYEHLRTFFPDMLIHAKFVEAEYYKRHYNGTNGTVLIDSDDESDNI